mgnify:CR=1
FKNIFASWNELVVLVLGAANLLTSSSSFATKTRSSTVPHLEFITYAPVVDWTFGTPPVKSISFTTTAGDSEGVES